MSQNHAIYKGFKVSANVRRSFDESPSAELARASFLATVTITQVSGDSGSLRLVPPLLEHVAHTPHDAIDLAVSYARTVIDDMSTFVKRK
ncbi:GTP cyclohydrolase [Cupriavidus sp. D39]|uniref:GTP cyclohydrolase n=1 Tax=Cupriavidus sp. D39 TaxID=2997877 RepID=UPI00226FF482|nr:GTP cyclohydrolase [Cupriavidus sp. D39]MCY0857931.1 GTP cyclohydrolase [Cupriavidus sp. D39]